MVGHSNSMETISIWFVSGHAGHNGGVCKFIG